MDADFSHHPKYLPAFLAGMDPENGRPVDVMIGSRMCCGGIEGGGLKRHSCSRGVNFTAAGCWALSRKIAAGPFAATGTALLERVDFDRVRARGYAFQEEILWHLKRAGARFAETPIVFVDRQRGSSKIDANEAILALWIIFALGVRNWIGAGP